MGEKQEYTVGELLDRLLDDSSWQPDPERRAAVVAELKRDILPGC